MKQLLTKAIILSRIDYGEADRILTLLTPDHGKLRLMAKGVRRIKSKLAGGIELFSISDITYIKGRGDMGTLVSSRLAKHYGRIVQTIERTMLGYDLIKQVNKVTEDEPEQEYFDLLKAAFEALDEAAVPLELVRFWFDAQLLRLGGHTPNLRTDEQGKPLEADATYHFDISHMAFALASTDNGRFSAGHIKLLRLVFSGAAPAVLAQVRTAPEILEQCQKLVATLRTHQ